MTFLSPQFLWLLPLGALPWIIHLWGRSRARTLPFSAVEGLVQATRGRWSFEQIRRWALLFLRTALLVLLFLLLARPVSQSRWADTADTLVLLDVSYSMGAVTAGRSALDAARARIKDLLDRSTPGARWALVAFSDRVEKTLPWTSDADVFRRGVNEISLSYRPTQWAAAWAGARPPLEKIPTGVRLCVISDFSENGWANPQLGRDNDSWILWDVGESPPNSAAIGLSGVFDGASQRWRGKIAHQSWGAFDRPDRSWSLRSNGRVLAQGRFPALGGAGESSFGIPASGAQERWEVQIEDDALGVDNVRFQGLQRPPFPAVLVVNGAPNLSPVSDETYYLQAVLETWEREGLRYRTVAPEELMSMDLKEWTALVLLNTGSVPEAFEPRLAEFMESGGRLCLAAGDRGAPRGLLGFPATWEGTQEGEEPLQGESSLEGTEGLLDPGVFPWGSVRVRRRWRVTPQNAALVHLRGRSSGAPVLLSADRGRGKMFLWTSTLDRDWTNFPATPLYPVLCRTLLSLPPQELPKGDFKVGDVYEGPRPTEKSPGMVLRPDGETEAMGESGNSVIYRRLDKPGFYRWTTDSGSERTWAVNLDTASGEGRMLKMPRDRFSGVQNGLVRWVDAEEDPARVLATRPWSPLLKALAVLLFILETGLLLARRGAR